MDPTRKTPLLRCCEAFLSQSAAKTWLRFSRDRFKK
jgi:hypothetical protein